MNEMVRIHPVLEVLRDIFSDIDLNEIFFVKGESAEQCLTGTVMGYQLDNAHGNHVSARAMIRGYQEFVVSLETFHKNRPRGQAFGQAEFNVATLIAVIRSHYKSIMSSLRNQGELMGLLNGIMTVTEGAREDMHEPDNQNIYAEIVSATREIDYRYHSEKDVEFVLYRETLGGPLLIKGPNLARMEVRFKVQDLIMLLMAIKD